MDHSSHDVTRLLIRWRGGDEEALEQMLPLVYDELRRQANRYLRRERAGHSLQTTALVHEAYLRLVEQTHLNWQNRAHFFAVCAQLMRRILVDHERRRKATKRGSGRFVVTLDEGAEQVEAGGEDLIALHDALDALSALDPQQGRIVELRYFAGLSIDETAEVLSISPATVKREWSIARAWLYNQLRRP